MAEEFQGYRVKCVNVEDGSKKGYAKFTFEYDLGKLSIEEEDRYWGIIDEGKEYWSVIKAFGEPDFVGQENKMKNLVTITRSLEKLVLDGDTIWKKK